MKLRTIKRVISLLLAVVMVMGYLPVTARAGQLDNGIRYQVVEDHVEITGWDSFDIHNHVVIPAEIEGLPVTTIRNQALQYCSSLHSIVLPDTVTTIGNSAFFNCYSLSSIDLSDSLTYIGDSAFFMSRLTGSIDIPDSVTYIGNRAFYGTGLTSVKIPDGITTIYHNTFHGCSGLTSVELPESVTSIGEYAFSYCSNLQSIDLPDNVTTIGAYAFQNCSNLQSIDLPDSVTTIGGEAFGYCSNLVDIYFRGDAPKFGAYAFNKVTATAYYPEDNETWTKAGVKEDYGGDITWLSHHYHEYEAVITAPTCTEQGYTTYTCACGYSLIADKVPALGHNEEIIPAVAATCTETGLTVDMKCTVCGEILIAQEIVPALGHDWMEADCYRPATCLRCGLTEGEHLEHEFKDGFCTRCGCRYDSIFRNYTFVVMDAATGQAISGAQVIIGGEGITTDTDGSAVFELRKEQTVSIWIRAAGYPDFVLKRYTPGEKLQEYLCLDSNANAITGAWCNDENVTSGSTQINCQAHALTAEIQVTGVSSDTIEKFQLVQKGKIIAESEDGSFRVANARFYPDEAVYVRMYTTGADSASIYERKLNIDVEKFTLNLETDWGELLPFSAGGSFSFPKGTPLLEGLTISIPNPFNRTQKASVYVCNDKVIVTFGIEIDFTEDLTADKKSAEEIFKELVNKWASDSKKSNERSVNGSAALVLEYAGGEVTRVYGQINVGFNLATSKGSTFFVGVIPVYAEVNAGLNGALKIDKLGYDYKNAKLLIPESEVELSGLLRLYGGLGCHVASAGVYGQGSVRAILNPSIKSFLEKLVVAGELGVYAKVKILFFKELCYRYPLLSDSFVWPRPQRQAYTEPYDLSAYQPADRSYLKDQTAWNSFGAETDGGIRTQNLQNSAYTAIEPEIVTCGDTTLMLFLDDDGSDGLNYQHLYYCVYDAQMDAWSEPVRVDSNVNPDVEFDVYADKMGIYLLYAQLDDLSMADENDYGKILSSAEIIFAHYNVEQQKFVEHTNISCNSTFDTFPQIAVTPEGILATWISNDTDDLFQLNTGNALMYSLYADGHWSGAATLGEPGATVVSMDAGTLDGRAAAALIRDLDCDLSTIDDRVLYLVDLQGNVTRINNERDSNDGVRFIHRSGIDHLVWYNGGNLYTTSSALSKPEPLLAESVNGLSGHYRFLEMADGSCSILFAQSGKNSDGSQSGSSDLYGIFCNDGIWGEPVAITNHEPGSYVDAFDAFESRGKLVIPYVRANVVITDADITKDCQFLSASMQPGKDLAVGEASVRLEQLTLGSRIELEIPVTNRSWQRVDRISWSLRDASGRNILADTCDLGDQWIGSGCTAYIPVVLSKSLLEPGADYTVYVENPDWTERDTANNTAQLQLWYTDFAVSAEQELVGEDLKLQYTVTNEGNVVGSVTINVCKYTDDGKTRSVLDTKTISGVAPGMGISGSFAVKDSYFAAGEDRITVYVEAVSDTRELYSHNDTAAAIVGGIERNTTTQVEESTELIRPPVIRESDIGYDLCEDADVLVSIEENGAVFDGISGMTGQDYHYSNGVLVIRAAYLRTLAEGAHSYTLTYIHSGGTTELMLTLSITDTRYRNAVVTVEDQNVVYDGQPVVLGQDILYSTESSGTVTAEYSADGGNVWNNGLPKDVGTYRVRLTVGQDDENRFLSASCTFRLAITKGSRTITAPEYRGVRDEQTIFGGSVSSGGMWDGALAYGYSLTNDVGTVEKWNSEGILPLVYTDTTFYVFARITGGRNYEDAYSIGSAIVANAAVCGHGNKTAVPAVEAGCEHTGHHLYYRCNDCGAILKADGVTKTTVEAEVIPALGHSWADADCEHPMTCSRCSLTKGEALGHDMGQWYTVTEATCTAEGKQQRDCSRCDHAEMKAIAATGHSYRSVVTAPTCTEQGFTTYICDCGARYIADMTAALGHTEEPIPAVAATCTQTGLTEGTKCSVCEEILAEQEEIPALGHTGETIPGRAATCTEPGLTEGAKCTVCEEILAEQEEIPALGHTGETIPGRAATCTEPGLTEGTKCTVCGETTVVQEEIPALGHDFINGACSRCDAVQESGFEDVPTGAFYFNPVAWALENGITTGATATTFNPNGQCLRAHVVTFLHRAAQNPEPTSGSNPFTDVKSADFFYKPVLWAVEKGITNGTSATTFGSYDVCNRAAVVTFLWRAAGSPAPESTVNPFTDVKDTDFFFKPVLWAVEQGITNGISATEFGPANPCNRAQVVTFLYRAYN